MFLLSDCLCTEPCCFRWPLAACCLSLAFKHRKMRPGVINWTGPDDTTQRLPGCHRCWEGGSGGLQLTSLCIYTHTFILRTRALSFYVHWLEPPLLQPLSTDPNSSASSHMSQSVDCYPRFMPRCLRKDHMKMCSCLLYTQMNIYTVTYCQEEHAVHSK